MVLCNVRVSDIVEETRRIKSFRLVRLDGRPFDPYEPGSHIDVTGPTGLTRQYSLVSPTHERDSWVIAVKRETESRGGSAALHELRSGQVLQIGQPRSLLAVAEGADRHLLVAAGIGVTPLVNIAHHLARADQNFEFHYYASKREDAAFIDLLQDRSGFGDRVHFHFGLAREDQSAHLEPAMARLTSSSHVYTCGPAGFMSRVESLSVPRVGEDHVHIEHFRASAPVEDAAERPFEVELDTGQIFEIPLGVSIVDVLRRNGVDVETACEEGVCGTCVTRVLAGVPDHRDDCLPRTVPAASDQMAICVSRSTTPRLTISMRR